MIDSDRTSNILIVSASEKFANSIVQLLNTIIKHHTITASSVEEASALFKTQHFDFLIINYTAGGHEELRFASACARKSSVIPVVIAKAEQQSELQSKLTSQGVYVLQKPLSAQTFLQAFRWMIAMNRRVTAAGARTVTLQQRMDEIRLVNRAKWALIANLKMSEADAHYYIEKQAMNRCITKAEVAGSILQTYSQASVSK